MQKAQPLKMRGVRLSDEVWEDIEWQAGQDKTGRTKASDVMRYAIEFYFKHKDNPNLSV